MKGRVIINLMIVLFKAVLFFLFGIIGIILIYVVYLYIPKSYTAESLEGRVLDELTRKPVEGAVVVVSWYSQVPHFHSPSRDLFEVQESVTDSYGRYFVPGWENKKLHKFSGSVSGDQPEILIYKDGYVPVIYKNKIVSVSDQDPKKTHPSLILWYGATELTLKSLTEEDHRAGEIFSDAMIYSPPFRNGCIWKKFPNFILELDRKYEREEIEKKFIYESKVSLNESNVLPSPLPWYLHKDYISSVAECPEIIDRLVNARKLRSKN